MLKLPHDYIRGLVDGEGTFTFSTTSHKNLDGKITKLKVPAFAIRMHERDEELIRAVRNTLGLTNSVYKYDHNQRNKDGYNRGQQAMLIVRETGQLKNIIIPFFYKKPHGNKGKQFFEWLEKMGNIDTTHGSKFLHMLYKKGYFETTLSKYP